MRKIRFEVRSCGTGPDPGRELLPFIDNASMVDLVCGYELAAGYDVPGAYAGTILERFNYGDLASYLTGTPDSAYWTSRGVIAVLGCDCGEMGCWPLEAHVLLDEELVTWRGFTQPFRRQRDYGTFGPSYSGATSTNARSERL